MEKNIKITLFNKGNLTEKNYSRSSTFRDYEQKEKKLK